MSAIHRWSFDLHRLRSPLLMRVTGLRLLDQSVLVLRDIISVVRLLTAAKLATSVGKDLLIREDVTGNFPNLRLRNRVGGPSRGRH